MLKLNIKWQDRTTYISVLEKVNTPKSLVNIILKKKLEYFGDVARRDGRNLEKQCMEGRLVTLAEEGQKLSTVGGLTIFVHLKEVVCMS